MLLVTLTYMNILYKTTIIRGFGALVIAALMLAIPMYALAESGGKKNGSGPTTVGSTLEVHIGNNGGVLVRGARVTSVSGSSITATTAWGSTNMTWTIRTDGTTQFLGRNGETITASTIVTGDYVSFAGTINSSFASPTVDAKVVKDWSIPQSETKVSGTVQSINVTGNSLIVVNGNGTTTVAVTGSTKITSGKDTVTLSSIVPNDKVKASGSFNASTRTLTATALVVDKKSTSDVKKDIRSIFKDAWGGKGWNWFFKNH